MRQAADQRRKAQLKIVHVLKLRGPPPAAEPTSSSPEPAPEAFAGFNPFNDAAPGDTVDIIQLHAALLAQGQEIDNIGSTGMQVACQIEKSLRDVQSEVRETQSSIDDLREDGTRMRSDVTSLREDLRNALDKYPHGEWLSTLKGLIKDRDDMIASMRKRENTTRRKVDDLGVRLDAYGQELKQATARDEDLQEDITDIKRHEENRIIIETSVACGSVFYVNNTSQNDWFCITISSSAAPARRCRRQSRHAHQITPRRRVVDQRG